MYDSDRKPGRPATGYPGQPQPAFGSPGGYPTGRAPATFGFAGVMAESERSLLGQVLGWLGLSIALTATGDVLYANGTVSIGILPALVLTFGSLLGCQWAAARDRHSLAVGLFGLLALAEGVFIGPVISRYLTVDPGVVFSALFGTVGIFILCAAVVWSTSYNFATWTKGLIIALIVGIVASIGFLFLGVSTLLVSAVIGVIFVGLTLADFSRVRSRQQVSGARSNSLVLALALYLDFLNLFLILLRLLGNRN